MRSEIPSAICVIGYTMQCAAAAFATANAARSTPICGGTAACGIRCDVCETGQVCRADMWPASRVLERTHLNEIIVQGHPAPFSPASYRSLSSRRGGFDTAALWKGAIRPSQVAGDGGLRCREQLCGRRGLRWECPRPYAT